MGDVGATTGREPAVFLGDFRFEPGIGRLWHAGSEIALRPKTAAVLTLLVARAGELVPKQELLSTVWPGGFVGDGALTVCVTELRQALGDDPHEPRFIATVHRRGYRLVIEPSASPAQPPEADRLFVGRGAELDTLAGWWERARSGRRSIGFIAGHAGVGKTALVERFLAEVRGGSGALVGVGQCVEGVGAGEPYLPVLDALAGMCRGPGGSMVVDVLRRYARGWLAQLPGFADAEPDAVRRVSTSRMLREFAAAMAELGGRRPLVLVFEDLHDADRSTVELIAYLARRPEQPRVLLVGTYRPAELIVRAHPLHPVILDLAARGLCRELSLELLSVEDVGRYVAAWLAPRVPSPQLVADVHERTEGNALFVAALCRHLTEQGLLVEASGQVSAKDRLEALGVPSEVRQMLQRRVDALGEPDRQLLAVAAVAGVEFAGETVRAGMGHEMSAADVEERCDRLVRAGALLRAAGTGEWPDGTLTARYRFTHEMYREVLYRGLGPVRRTAAHRAIGERLAAGYGSRTGEVAAELAAHFEAGRDYLAAATQRSVAALTALSRSAYLEAHEHIRHGLRLLERVADDETRARLELALRRSQVVATAATWGWQDPAAYASCLRLRELARQCDDVPAHVAALLGLHNVAMMRGDATARLACAEQVQELADGTGNASAELIAHLLQIHLSSRLGACADMWRHAQRMLELYQPAKHADLAVIVGEEPSVAAHQLGAVALWQLGHPDQARQHVAIAVEAARALEIPADVARALWYAGIVHLLCGAAAQVRELAREMAAICSQYELRLWQSGGAVLGGWASVMLADTKAGIEAGLAQLREGIAGWAEFARIGSTFHASVAGAAYLVAGQVTEALAAVREGLDAVQGDGERQSEPELLRLHGQLLLRLGDPARGEQELVRAFELAQRRQARGFQLRAAITLADLRRDNGDPAGAAELLASVYGTFTEGHDTRDVQLASAVLAGIRP